MFFVASCCYLPPSIPGNFFMKSVLLAVATAAAMSGCASLKNQPIAINTTKELRGQTVAQTKRPTPDFAAMTPGKMGFALVGALLMISEGNSIIANNNVADPADAIASGLMKALESAHGTNPAGQKIAVKSTAVSDIAAAAGDTARFVIDVQTINWTLVYFSGDWTHYRVVYSAKARLINTLTKATVAEGFCARAPESNIGAPTYDEFIENEAAVLKKELSLVVEECVNTIKTGMLAL
jgi:hypothetical protein